MTALSMSEPYEAVGKWWRVPGGDAAPDADGPIARLQSLKSATEAFHRTRYPEQPLADVLHGQLESRMLAVLEDEHPGAPARDADAAACASRLRYRA